MMNISRFSICTAWNSWGRQAEASSASTLRSWPENTRAWPVLTTVALMNKGSASLRKAASST